MIAVIDYGAGNIRSVVNGLKKVGGEAKVVDDPRLLKDANGIILPGVGSFGDAMTKLEKFKPKLVESFESGVPYLGICLGLQVLFESSEESPGIEGIGIFKGGCRRFTGNLKVPHMGWNTIEKTADTPLLEGIADGDFFYFVHSYHVVPNDGGIIAAETEYGLRFPSVISKGNIHATQFHPEKSGEKGLQILSNFTDCVKR
ncbi:MAG: imidazole glycerol phosphate synthase subunit HisH [Candidatus Altiarchaeota archaeon]